MEDFTDNKPKIELWDENVDVFLLFQRYCTQWRMGPRGPIGLDMSVFHDALDRKGIKGNEFDDFVVDLGVIEAAALGIFNEELANPT